MNAALTAIAVAIATSVAAGCVLLEPAPTTAAPPARAQTIDERDACGAKALTHLIGKSLGDAGVPAASSKVRHIRPGDAVTEDLRIERLNLYVTGAGVIETINCG